ncbi:uncharacterized protein LOC103162167, partial [Cricetulus griseus]|uniref:uncharacterized protein LOC103162167 n=1 Tax=Cricetulus griseus TaxID=10029 RepID=UPI0004542919
MNGHGIRLGRIRSPGTIHSGGRQFRLTLRTEFFLTEASSALSMGNTSFVYGMKLQSTFHPTGLLELCIQHRTQFEKEGFALGVLGHQLGPFFAPVAYLSKKLDLTTQGWASCIRALAAAELLIRESKKLTFGSPITVFSHHNLSHLLTYRGLQTLPPSRVLSLQVALVEDATLTFQSCPPLNISNFLPQPNANYSPTHSCIETLEELLPHPSHIQEGTLPQATYTWYTDGSSFLHEGTRKAGYGIVSDTRVVEARALPAHTTNQQAELIALTRAFQLAQGHSLNVYTDSKYAFHILLSHAAIWKERGLLTTRGGSITNSDYIMAMLRASHVPKAIGIIH